MDCFYAAVEMRDKPHLQGKPVAVGSTSRTRGALCTCNYEARKCGVRAAMPTWKALNKCPDLILLPVSMDKYKAVSKSIHKIFNQYTDIIEPLSLDEAFLDVSNSSIYNGSATLIAQAIRRNILRQEAITASAGISFNKFLAKIASDLNKPNGQYVIRPEDKDKFIVNLTINKIHGVGKVTAKKLHELGISTCHDLQQLEIKDLINIFGKYGRDLYYLSRGVDNRIVQTARPVKSVSVEETYDTDLNSFDTCKSKLVNLYSKLLVRLSKCSNNKINTLFVKLKFRDFTQTTVETKFSVMDLKNFSALIEQAIRRRSLPVRLIGIGVRFIEHIQSPQLEFNFQTPN